MFTFSPKHTHFLMTALQCHQGGYPRLDPILCVSVCNLTTHAGSHAFSSCSNRTSSSSSRALHVFPISIILSSLFLLSGHRRFCFFFLLQSRKRRDERCREATLSPFDSFGRFPQFPLSDGLCCHIPVLMSLEGDAFVHIIQLC